MADRADAALEREEFAAAGKLFARATSAPDSPDQPISADQRFDFRCKAALAWWLADDVQAVIDACSVGVPDGPDAEGQRSYLGAFVFAMVFHGAELKDRKLEILTVVPTLQVALEVAGSIKSDGEPPTLAATWPTLARLPQALAVWAALDRRQLDLDNYQLVARMEMNTDVGLPSTSGPLPKPAATQPATQPGDDWRPPPDSLTYRTSEFGGSTYVLLPIPVRADQGQSISDWIAWFGQHKADRGEKELFVSLYIGVRRGPTVVACVKAKTIWKRGQAGDPRIVLPNESECKRFQIGLKVIDSAMPDGATPVATRGQAEMVAAAWARFVPNAPAVRIQPQDKFFWVLPGTRAGEKPARQTMIPLIAGWLALHEWKDLPATQPATSEPDVVDDPPGDPEEP
ncbi:MAG: hypothetical protein PHU85_12320 [Phycisphaerae bacterium]|nr:hypothetical protein [Phycisphaerae bacterium]